MQAQKLKKGDVVNIGGNTFTAPVTSEYLFTNGRLIPVTASLITHEQLRQINGFKEEEETNNE